MLSLRGAKSSLARRFAASKAGSFSVWFSAASMMIVGAMAVALDASTVLNAKSSMQNELDGAVLAAVQEDTTANAEAKLEAYLANFTVNGRKVKNVDVEIIKFDGKEIVAEARGVVPITVGSVVGVKPVPIVVRAAAQRGGDTPGVVTPDYQDLIFAVDLSGSLGIAATPEDIVKLQGLSAQYMPASHYGNNLPQGCAFGCHRREGWEPGTKTMYQIARENNVRLREDELISQFGGLANMLLDPTDASVIAGKVKVSVVAFSNVPLTLVTRSSDLPTVKGALNNFPTSLRWETYFGNAFAGLSLMLGVQGDGTAASKPRKTLIIITDGIESRDAFFAQSAMDTYPCKVLKDKGFNVAIVELKYPKLLNNFLYRDTVLPVESAISPAIKACASEGWYFQAQGNSDVPVKFEQLKNKIGGGANGTRLTQ